MASPSCDQVFCGTIVHSTAQHPMSILPDKAIGVSNKGSIVFVENRSQLPKLMAKIGFESAEITDLSGHQFLMPGFIDTHIHACQYSYIGTGYDLPLLGWLERYTYPTEALFKDQEFARKVYRKVVNRTLNNGTTTASYFGTIHYEATTVLADVVEEFGQRAYVGKVCLDTNSPEYYKEDTQQSVEDTERFIQYVQKKANSLITPVITPRFAVCCSKELMTSLASLATKYQLPIQSHLSENIEEINFVNKTFPNCGTYTGVYHECGLLGERSYFAHCCHVSSTEALLLAKSASGVAHCPASNVNLESGLADVRFLDSKNIKLGLGTDIAGGDSCSMVNAIRSAVSVSKTIAINNNISNNSNDSKYRPISHKEAFYMATLGGSRVLGLDKTIGNFEVGKEFDALLVDTAAEDSPFECFEQDSVEDVVQKFFYNGDDRNIRRVYVAGRCVGGREQLQTQH